MTESAASPRHVVPGYPVLGTLDALGAMLQRARPRRIVVALDERRRADVIPVLLEARGRGIAIEDAVDVYERITGKLAIEALPPANLGTIPPPVNNQPMPTINCADPALRPNVIYATGSTNFSRIAAFLAANSLESKSLLLGGFALLLVGLGFKV